MSDIVINKHNFEKAKKEIKEFSLSTAKEVKFDQIATVKTPGEFFADIIFNRGIGLGHTVKGEELCELTKEIQKHLVDINDVQIKLIKQFGEVYNALEYLDKDYIQAILVSLKATEKTSEAIKSANNNIKKVVNNQVKTIEALNSFKLELENYEHLRDIDEMWHVYQDLNIALKNSTEYLAEFEGYTVKNSELLKVLQKDSQTLNEELQRIKNDTISLENRADNAENFINEIEQLEHLRDIDLIWNETDSQRNIIKGIHDEFIEVQEIATDNHEKIIQILSTLKNITGEVEVIQNELGDVNEKLISDEAFLDEIRKIEHLMDVDNLWSSSNEYNERLQKFERINKEQSLELGAQSEAIGEITNQVNQNKVEGDTKLADFVDVTNIKYERLTNKIKHAYILAGGATILATFEFLYIFLRG